jgi:hypothetical protein
MELVKRGNDRDQTPNMDLLMEFLPDLNSSLATTGERPQSTIMGCESHCN